MRAKTMKRRKGKSMKYRRRKGKSMKNRRRKGKTAKHLRKGKTAKHHKKTKKRRKIQKGGMLTILKDAIVPFLFTGSVIGMKKGKGKGKK